MPLSIIRRTGSSRLYIHGTVTPAGAKTGIRVRQRAGSDDEATAREEAVALEREILRAHHLGERPQARSFAQATESYLKHEPRSERTLAIVERLLRHFAEMPLDKITQEAVDKTRGILVRHNAVPATMRRQVVMPLSAIMRHAYKRGWGPMPNFDLPNVGKKRTRFLLPEEAERLVGCAAPHLQPLLQFLFCTGCRMNEALQLQWADVDLLGRRAILWEDKTKSEKRRVIDLVPGAMEALEALSHRMGPVFLTARKQAYRSSEEYGGQIKTAWRTACRKAKLKGISPHVTRHSWASWEYALRPDPMQLMVKGGWSQLSLVQRYAHLIPVGHEDAVRRVWGLARSEVRVSMAQG